MVRDGQLEFADFVAVDKRQSRLPSLFIQLMNPCMPTLALGYGVLKEETSLSPPFERYGNKGPRRSLKDTGRSR
ncbi:hypothetical protein Tco_0525282 [Tanacetum coccineum]